MAGESRQVAELQVQVREAAERERAVSEILRTISGSGFDLHDLLQTVIESAVGLSHAEFGDIALPNAATGRYEQVAYAGDYPPELQAAVTSVQFRPDRRTLIGRTLVERRPVHIADVLADPEYDLPEVQGPGRYRTVLGAPMLRDGAPIGFIVLGRRVVKPFTAREIALVTTLADQAVLAIAHVSLFQTVERQRTELARFAPQVADLLSSEQGEQLLAGHRRQITALFADLRQFTAFAETSEPEEVLGVLRTYHSTAGEVIQVHGGTIEHFAGDGLMAFFNDPMLLARHERVAVAAALELRDRFGTLALGWQKLGYDLGLGIGIATGYATLGRIGFEGRYDYGAVGNVVILASRLSDAAGAGEILVSRRLQAVLEADIETEPVAPLPLKGFSRPEPAFRVLRMLA
jgi:class 3 adenylate cyclase